MDREEIIWKFQKMRQSREGGARAPHKPLLVLYAIGRLLRDGVRLIPYSEVDEKLGDLLKEFGPRQTNIGTHYPFWRLRNDEVWEIPNADNIGETANGDALISDLVYYNASGGFLEEIAEQFLNDSRLVSEVIQTLLYNNFPYSIHEDILQAVEIESPLQIFQWQMPGSEQRRRDPNFRPKILKAYKYKCAICGFDATLGTTSLALEAAHIKWHTHHGPDVVVNGLALCSLHHKLFDRGAFTLSREREICVSGHVRGTVGLEEWLMKFHGEQINFPQMISDYPAVEYLDWHVRAVFKGKPREL